LATKLRAATARPCSTRPAHWWESDDPDANRAIAACRTCPFRTTCTTADGQQPRGIIVAGMAYDDDGRIMTLHSCGRPMVRRGNGLRCNYCASIGPKSAVKPAEYHRLIFSMLGAGASFPQVGRAIGADPEAVKGYVRRWRAARRRDAAKAVA
jgi:hypothetical protein